MYKSLLITPQNTNLNSHVLKTFANQITLVLKNQADLFTHYGFFFDALFEIVIETKHKKSLRIISNIGHVNLKSGRKSSDHADFDLLLIEKTGECLQYLIKNEHVYKESEKTDSKSPVELFAKFAQSYADHLRDELKDKHLAKHCLDLIILIFKHLPRSEPCLFLVETLLNKEDFFLLRNHQPETMLILSKALDYVYDTHLAMKNPKSHEPMRQIIWALEKLIAPFQTLVDSMQALLCEKLVFKPIEQLNVISDDYFKIVNSFFGRFVNLKMLSFDSNELKRLKECVKIAISRLG